MRGVVVEHDARRPGRPRGRARAGRRAGVSTRLCPGAAATSDDRLVEPERLAARRAASATCPLCGGSKAPPKSPITATNSNDSVADLDRGAAPRARLAQRPLELLLARAACPTTRKPPSVRMRLQRRAFGSGPVDEEVGELGARPRAACAGSGTSAKSALRKRVDPSPGRAREPEDGDDPLVGDRERRVGLEVDLVEDDDLRQLVEPGAVGDELGVDRLPLLARAGFEASITWTRRARPLEVGEELVPEPDPLARALDQAGDVGDDELAAVGRLDRRRAPAASVVNG